MFIIYIYRLQRLKKKQNRYNLVIWFILHGNNYNDPIVLLTVSSSSRRSSETGRI